MYIEKSLKFSWPGAQTVWRLTGNRAGKRGRRRIIDGWCARIKKLTFILQSGTLNIYEQGSSKIRIAHQ